MVITDKLEQHFDKTREIDTARLDVLKSLGLDPKFEAKCEEMFKQINASVDEVFDVKKDLIAENKKITGILSIKSEIIQASNNVDYNSNRTHRNIAS